MTRRALWLPASVFVVHVVASRFFLAYEFFPRLDIPMHLLGGVAIGFLWYVALETASARRLVRRPERVVRMVLLFSLVCAAAVFWEFAEWVSDHTIGTHAQQGLEDTLKDMLLGIIGGVAFLVVAEGRTRNGAAV